MYIFQNGKQRLWSLLLACPRVCVCFVLALVQNATAIDEFFKINTWQELVIAHGTHLCTIVDFTYVSIPAASRLATS